MKEIVNFNVGITEKSWLSRISRVKTRYHSLMRAGVFKDTTEIMRRNFDTNKSGYIMVTKKREKPRQTERLVRLNKRPDLTSIRYNYNIECKFCKDDQAGKQYFTIWTCKKLVRSCIRFWYYDTFWYSCEIEKDENFLFVEVIDNKIQMKLQILIRTESAWDAINWNANALNR